MNGMIKIATGGLLLMLTTTASAMPLFFNNRADFQAAATGALSVESFEGPGQYGATHSYADFDVSESGGVNIITNYLDNSCCVNPVTDGRNAIWYDDNGSSIGTFFNFTGSGVYAFGLDITADTDSLVTITGGESIASSVGLVAGTSQFWGVIDSNMFSSVSIDASGGPNIGFDYVEYQLAKVPEPGSLALLGIGLVGLGFAKRKK